MVSGMRRITENLYVTNITHIEDVHNKHQTCSGEAASLVVVALRFENGEEGSSLSASSFKSGAELTAS